MHSSSPDKLVTSELFPSTASNEPSSPVTEPGDGFTAEEVDAVLHPPSAQWAPTHDYEEVLIGSLDAGPKFVTFVGRVVNCYDIVKPSKRPLAARGCLKLMVADDTGALTVSGTARTKIQRDNQQSSEGILRDAVLVGVLMLTFCRSDSGMRTSNTESI
jgi:hypothetical protein